MIKKEGNNYSVWSESGKKRLGKPSSKKQAVKRLREVEYFKHHPKKAIGLKEIPSLPSVPSLPSIKKSIADLGLDYKGFIQQISKNIITEHVMENKTVPTKDIPLSLGID